MITAKRGRPVGRTKATSQLMKKLVAGYLAGEKMPTLAKKYNCTRQYVSLLLTKAGLDVQEIMREKREAKKFYREIEQANRFYFLTVTAYGDRKPEFVAYLSMLRRCYDPKNPNYKKYGGRGVKVCPEWRGKNGWKTFYAEMGQRPPGKTANGRAVYSIHRIDNAMVYSAATCKWVTQKEQCAPGQRRKHKKRSKIQPTRKR